jgi:DNA replication protein DnaC
MTRERAKGNTPDQEAARAGPISSWRKEENAMPDRHAKLAAMLHALKLPAMATSFAELELKANLTPEAFLYELVRAECARRDQHRIARLRRQSGLPPDKTFQTLELDRFPPAIRQQIERLRSGAFVAEAINIVAAGPPGVGKTHLLAALGHELILRGHPVFWTPTESLIQRLLAAKRDLRLPEALARLDRFACVILDDIGYVQHDRDETEVLFTFLAGRYERRSVAIATNLVFSDWNRIFKDPMTTLAAIERVVHRSVMLDLMGMEGYRAQEAFDQKKKPEPAGDDAASGESDAWPMPRRPDRGRQVSSSAPANGAPPKEVARRTPAGPVGREPGPEAVDVTQPPPGPPPAPPAWSADLAPLLARLPVAGACPFLGLRDDPTAHRPQTCAEHRCYATGAALEVDRRQQHLVCLTEWHRTCLRFLRTSTNAGRPPRQPGRPPACERLSVFARVRRFLR